MFKFHVKYKIKHQTPSSYCRQQMYFRGPLGTDVDYPETKMTDWLDGEEIFYFSDSHYLVTETDMIEKIKSSCQQALVEIKDFQVVSAMESDKIHSITVRVLDE